MRPRWSALGFATRVARSRDALFVVVEGRRFDPVFYDRLCGSDSALRQAGYQVRPIDTIDMPRHLHNTGKLGVLDFFRLIRSTGKLTQTTRSGPRIIACIVDRDLDEFTRRKLRSPHLIYTHERDVEAELHRNGDIARALATALSATEIESQALASHLGDYTTRLADRWRDWIELGALALAINARCSVQPGRPSQVNVDMYGSVSGSLLATARSTVLGAADPSCNVPYWVSQVRSYFTRVFRTSVQARQVKGKWLAGFVEHEIRFVAGNSFDYRGFPSLFSHALLDSLDYSDAWAARYTAQLKALRRRPNMVSRQAVPPAGSPSTGLC